MTIPSQPLPPAIKHVVITCDAGYSLTRQDRDALRKMGLNPDDALQQVVGIEKTIKVFPQK